MKILHYIEGRCARDTANGVDKVVYFLSKSQATSGHEVCVLCESDKEVLPVPGVNVVNTPRFKSCFRLSSHAKEAVIGFEPDVIHLHSAYIPTGISLARFARARGIPYVISPHGNYSTKLGKRRKWLKFIYKNVFELPCARSAAWVHSMGDEESIRGFGYGGKVVTVPNGYDMSSRIDYEGAQGLVEEKIPALKGKKLILFIGRLDFEQKGMDILIEAFASAKLEDAFLLIVGPTWKDGEERARSLARELGLGKDRLIFWGSAFGEEKAALLNVASVFIHASRWEGFPMAVIEAMAYEKLCVVTRAADPQGILEKLDLGIVSGGEVKDLSGAMKKAISMDTSESQRMGRQAMEVVRDQFSWDFVASEMIEAYQKI